MKSTVLVNMTEEEEEAYRHDPEVSMGEFFIENLGIATVFNTKGIVRVFVRKDIDEILGARIEAIHAEELAGVIRLAIKSGAKGRDLAHLIYPHPTFTEGIGEAANLAVYGHSIHNIIEEKEIPEDTDEFEVVVIGAGPGGYAAAIKAALLGLKVAIVTTKEGLGGTCLNCGCIPTKELLNKVENIKNLSEIIKGKDRLLRRLRRGVEVLLEKRGVKIIYAEALLGDSNFKDGQIKVKGKINKGEKQEIEKIIKGEKIIIATGTQPFVIPGVEIDGQNIITSDHALQLENLPKRMTIVGGGVIGIEFAYIFQQLGVEVTVVEGREQILPDIVDNDVATRLQKSLEQEDSNNNIKGVKFQIGEPWKSRKAEPGERILIAIGRSLPKKAEQAFKKQGLEISTRHKVVVDNNMKVVGDNLGNRVYAIGDIVSWGPDLAHVATWQAEKAALHIARELKPQIREALEEDASSLDNNPVPGVIFSNPSVATVGLNEGIAKKAGIDVEAKLFKTADKENTIKVIIEKGSDKVLGVIIFGPTAPYAIAEMTLAVKMGLSLDQLKGEGLTLESATSSSAVDAKAWASAPGGIVMEGAGIKIKSAKGSSAISSDYDFSDMLGIQFEILSIDYVKDIDSVLSLP